MQNCKIYETHPAWTFSGAALCKRWHFWHLGAVTPQERTFLLEAQKRIGAPYIWAGKGDHAIRDQGRIAPMAELGCERGFDCSGFVTDTARAVGSNDLRGWWNAHAMLANLPEPAADETLRLVLYGTNGHADHVALELAPGLVMEAAGGDSTTLDAIAAARSPYLVGGARVGIWPETHHQRLGVRSLRALLAAPQIPSK